MCLQKKEQNKKGKKKEEYVMKKYDYLIVGAGLFGAVFAHEAKEAGKTCLVIDKRNHIAGNIYTDKVKDIDVHQYGAHIFHTYFLYFSCQFFSTHPMRPYGIM